MLFNKYFSYVVIIWNVEWINKVFGIVGVFSFVCEGCDDMVKVFVG